MPNAYLIIKSDIFPYYGMSFFFFVSKGIFPYDKALSQEF